MPRILLVEDEPLNQDMLTRRLRRKQFDVVLAADGEEAVVKARAEAPDVVLMDIKLPVVDGYEATRRLKADAATREIPVIALTSYAMSGDREKALAAGCDDYATKPVDFAELLLKVENLI